MEFSGMNSYRRIAAGDHKAGRRHRADRDP
jgi:hypothetical protein